MPPPGTRHVARLDLVVAHEGVRAARQALRHGRRLVEERVGEDLLGRWALGGAAAQAGADEVLGQLAAVLARFATARLSDFLQPSLGAGEPDAEVVAVRWVDQLVVCADGSTAVSGRRGATATATAG